MAKFIQIISKHIVLERVMERAMDRVKYIESLTLAKPNLLGAREVPAEGKVVAGSVVAFTENLSGTDQN